jgi:hypothetical protein
MLIKMNGGIGDMLLLTIITKKYLLEYGRPCSLLTLFPEIFTHNPSIKKIYTSENLILKIFEKLNLKFHDITYRCWSRLLPERKDLFNSHVVEQFCYQLGLHGNVQLKPELYYIDNELDFPNLPSKPYVVVQSQASNSNHPQTTKNWGLENIQTVVNYLSKGFNIIQLGDKRDLPLENTTCLTGKTSIRDSGLILKNANLFVGLEGALMHIARAVDCQSVIIWGGRLKPHQVGYPCFENINVEMDCSPCWIPNACPNDMACMKEISPRQVIDRIENLLASKKEILEVDEILVSKKITPKKMKEEILKFPPHLDHLIQGN